ncbi:unnamed protein product [Moneuplotes crassus]|uniref:Uncharacterized protein n=1 Tax=Euplotes crassus TaxID=5936 RepID=A0AAD1U0U0_EUPCR|nr:unnamed protein product [Moneuplotes crassus]
MIPTSLSNQPRKGVRKSFRRRSSRKNKDYADIDDNNLAYISKMIDDFKYKVDDLSYTEKKALQNSYNVNIEDELVDAYKAINSIEKDLKKLVSVSEMVLEKCDDYDIKLQSVTQEKQDLASDIQYLQEMYDQVKEREVQKNSKMQDLEQEIENLQNKNKELKQENDWFETKISTLQEETEIKADEIDQEKANTDHIDKKYRDKLSSLRLEIDDKKEEISILNKALENERNSADAIEKQKDKFLKEISALKETNKDIKEKMHHYKKSCRKINDELQKSFQINSELEMKIAKLEMERTQHFHRPQKKLGESIPSNLLQMKDTKESQNLFDYQNNTLDEDLIDEDIHEVEFSDIVSDKNKTCQLDSLADELDFYDQADDQHDDYYYNNTEVYEDQAPQNHDFQTEETLEIDSEEISDQDEHILENSSQSEFEVRYQTNRTMEERLEMKSQEENYEEDKHTESSKEDILIQDQHQRKNTGTSSDLDSYMLCKNCMKEKGIIYEKKESEEAKSSKSAKSNTSEKEDKNLAYLKNRNPMKEFFVLTAQAVKLNSPYMNTILNLHVNQMYEQVQKDNTPFYKWSEWIEETLHRIIVKKIYSEAFIKQNMNKILSRPRSKSHSRSPAPRQPPKSPPKQTPTQKKPRRKNSASSNS